MKLMRSDSPGVVRGIASARAWASRNWFTLGFVCAANLLALLIGLAVSLIISARSAVWVSIPALVALNGYVLCRPQASHRRWVVVGRSDRLYVRLFTWRSGDHDEINDQDVLVLDGSEIASMSVRTVDVFLYGPRPKSVEWLIIEPTQGISEDVSGHICPLLTPNDPAKAVLVACEGGRLTIEWKWWRPDLRRFLQQAARECPSVVIGQEESSELDLNGIWNGIWSRPDVQQRRMLVQAKRLGFGCECAALLSRHRYMPYKKAAAYLNEIERTGPETEPGEWPALSLLGVSLAKTESGRVGGTRRSRGG
jgi:hypothetical protein